MRFARARDLPLSYEVGPVICLINACMVIAARVLVLRFHILRYLLSLPVSICGESDLTNLTDSRPTIQ
jgi:hypothetical protein